MRALFLGLLLLATPAAGQNLEWTVGEERELAPNNYAKLVTIEGAWRLWRFESPDGPVCVAVIGAEGIEPPTPTGDAQKMRTRGPYLALSGYKKNVRASLMGSANGAWAKYRRSGERFWTDEDVLKPDLSKLDGARVEVHVTSFQYPHIQAGPVVDQGTINFTGYLAMRARVADCTRQPKGR